MISPSTAAEAAATIIALTAYGVTKIQTEYREHAEKELSDQMVGISRIYNESLKDMLVQGIGENAKISMPPIFIMDPLNPDKPVKSLILNDLILQDLSSTYPSTSADLLSYGERVHNAMQALRQFYYLRTEKRNRLHRGKQTDLTSSVLSYMILMISTHCYKFEGIETTLTYLRGFQKFAQRYGSFGGKGKKSDRYQHMALVYKELNIAESLLRQYSLTLSYTSYLNLLIPQVTGFVNELMRCAVKIITPTKHWDLIEYANAQNFLDGVIKVDFDYGHEGLFGNSPAIPIKESPMKEKIKICAKNYFTAIRINDDPENKAAFVADDTFTDRFSKSQYAHIMEIARDCDNFLTAKIKPTHREGLSDWLTVNKLFVSTRIKAYQDLIGLINKLTTLMYYCCHLSNRVKQLGEIYITNPHHCVYIFEIFNEFGTIVDEQVKAVMKSMGDIVKDNGQLMPVTPSQSVYEILTEVLNDIRTNTIPLIKNIYIKHTEHPKTTNVDFSKAIKENVSQMITIAKKIADQYNIKTQLSEQVKHEPSPMSRSTPSLAYRTLGDAKDEKNVRIGTPGTLTRSISVPALNLPVDNIMPIGAPQPLETKAMLSARSNDFNETTINDIGNLIHDIRLINADQADDYARIYQAIDELRHKAVALRLEDAPKRKIKGKKLESILNKICGDFKTFLQLSQNERYYEAETFDKKMRSLLRGKEAEFLDVHQRSYGFWKTHSRSLADKVVRNSDRLARISKSYIV